MITGVEWELPPGSFAGMGQLRGPAGCVARHRLAAAWINSSPMYNWSFSFQVWDAIEGTLRSTNEEGQSGITALVFLNNR